MGEKDTLLVICSSFLAQAALKTHSYRGRNEIHLFSLNETFRLSHTYYIVMTNKKTNNQNKKGGMMKVFLTILLLMGVSVAQVGDDQNELEYVGSMPMVEVVAQRIDEVGAYVGSMPEVTVTAPRYEYEDVAWSGLMPEVVVTAVRPTVEGLVYLNNPE